MLRAYILLGSILLAVSTVSTTSLAAAQSAGDSQSDDPGRPAKKATAKKKSKKKASHSDTSSAATSDDAASATTPETEASSEPDAWEKPPADEEKAPAPPPVAPKLQIGDGKHWTVNAELGWGFLTDRKKERLGADAYRLELGLRGGYGFESGLYVGVFYSYYLGSTLTGSTQGTGQVTSSTAHYMLFGGELGYELWTKSVLIRPSLAVGGALGFTTKVNTQSPVGALLIAPGLSVVKPFDSFFLGGDLRFNLVSGNGNSGVTLGIQGGLRFE